MPVRYRWRPDEWGLRCSPLVRLMMQQDSLVQLKDFTHDSAAKATVASGGVLMTVMRQLCDATQTGAITCQVVSGISDLLKILVAMMVLDLITGVWAARSEGQRIESKRLSIGMKRKVVMLLIVASSVMLDGVFHAHGIPTGHLLYSWTASWFIAVEGLSLYENAGRLGVPLPRFLKSIMEFLLQRAEKGGAGIVAAEAAVNEAESLLSSATTTAVTAVSTTNPVTTTEKAT